ncbi:GIY-YIG nuclease family protein [Geodermatophilus arenarius]|uniref:GIY-YIG nuclease family protein n=1 Tax=Geodermatophilus arenarius TaxID=1137990 RepID=A0ABV9LJ63_9ACTN
MPVGAPRGVSIRIYLADGKPQGLRVVDRAGWTGTCLAFARADYGEARLRDELRRSGAYVLIGPQEDGRRPSRVYIGEGDEVRTRLDSHHREKDFWTHGYVLTTKDDSLNKAHVRYLEARLLHLAAEADAAVRENGTLPPVPRLGESEEADLEWYLDTTLTLLPLVGVTIFDVVKDRPAEVDHSTGARDESPLEGVEYFLQADLTEATARDDSRGFAVLAGALGRSEAKVMTPSYKEARDRLIAERVLVPHGDKQLRLTKTYLFDSPSQAASVLAAGSKNGRDAWRDAQGRTLKQNQERVAAGLG